MQELYEKILLLISELIVKHKISMTLTQAMILNGFKRWHCFHVISLTVIETALRKELLDRYKKTPQYALPSTGYTASDIKSHLEQWEGFIAAYRKQLGEYHKQYVAAEGFGNDCVKRLHKILLKDFEKIVRWYHRFNAVNWSEHDIRYVDDALHKKMKKREEKTSKKH